MDSLQIDLSVVIPTYNRKEELSRCLAGFEYLKASRFSYEIIVVDDGGAVSVGDELGHQFTSLPIRWLRQVNQGPATARNSGAKAARGKFVAFIDDDCLPDPEWLVMLFENLVAQPSGLIGGESVNGLPNNLFSEASQQLVRFLYAYFEGKNGRFFTSNNFALSRHLFLQIGGFDESMPLAAGEDREFCRRWLEAGLMMLFEPKAKVYHFHALSLRSFWQQHFNYGRGAKQYHKLGAQQKQKKVKLEPLSFYWRLIFYPLRKRPFALYTLKLIPLMFLSQLANATGYFYER